MMEERLGLLAIDGLLASVAGGILRPDAPGNFGCDYENLSLSEMWLLLKGWRPG